MTPSRRLSERERGRLHGRDWSRWLVRQQWQQQAQQQAQIAPVMPVDGCSAGLVGLLLPTIRRLLSDGRIAWSGCWYCGRATTENGLSGSRIVPAKGDRVCDAPQRVAERAELYSIVATVAVHRATPSGEASTARSRL